MAEKRIQRKLTTILAADVEGYSRLMSADEEATFKTLKTYREIIDDLIAKHNGRLVGTAGDAVLVEFGSAVEAVRCALSIQEDLAARNADLVEERRMSFRIGINVGDVMVEGDDLYGDGVNVAARLEGLCEPGEVFVSGSVYDQVVGKIESSFDDLGKQTVKNIARPIITYRVRSGSQTSNTGSSKILSSRRPSLACLPFKYVGDDPSQAHVADGMRLAIQASLVQAPGLLLIAPPAVSRYRNNDIPVQQVAKEMGARYVLEGTAQRAGERIRITAQLTDTQSRQVVWAERFDRDFSDTLATQDEITAKIVTSLGIKVVSGGGFRQLTTLKNLDAVDAFYRGLNHFYAQSKDDNAAAKGNFEDVARLQPDSPIGPAFMSMAHWMDAFRGWTESKNRSIMEAIEWAEKTVKFEGTNGLAHIVVGCIHLLNQRYDEALSMCTKAVELRPSCPIANINLATILHYCGRSDEAVDKIQETIRIFPFGPPWFLELFAAAYREIGDFERSVSTAKEAIERFPQSVDARLNMCSCFVSTGMSEEAKETTRSVMEIDPTFSVTRYFEKQPYRFRDDNAEHRFAESLRQAGLPE